MSGSVKKYTREQQVILLELGRMYDDNGYLMREDARYACAMAGQRALDTFHALEKDGSLQFSSDGSLYYLPSDEQITGK